MSGSSAPGTLYSALSGIIIAAIARKSSRCAGLRPLPAVTAVSTLFIAASIEQIGQTLFHLVRDIERNRLDGGGRVDAAGGDEHAAVDDEEVLHVVRAAPFVHHRALGIPAHPRGAEQMPAAIGDRAVEADVARPHRSQDLLGARDAVLHHFPA